MLIDDIRNELNSLKDEEYRAFQSKLIPTVGLDHFIGVRTPELRSLAKKYGKNPDVDIFLNDLPHKYFDEDQLHAFILSGMKDFGKCAEEVSRFLPYVDNWATCDQMSPKIFKKNRGALLSYIDEWIRSDKTYTIRFAIGMLMEHFLDDDFDIKFPVQVSNVRSDEYYVKMMIAWYFATALAKQYDQVIPFIEEKKLDPWIHNKTIQKAVESYRISSEQKDYLRSLKVKIDRKGNAS